MDNNKGTMIDLLTSLSKQRGFIFQSSEIYGGLGSTWDYGPLGTELKRNIKNLSRSWFPSSKRLQGQSKLPNLNLNQ